MRIATMADEAEKRPSVTIGRYLLHRQIARGGMATIHIARLMGDEGFSRIVAAKRLLPEFAEDSEFVAMFMDEARIASKVHHPNVVPVLDLVTTNHEVMLVQEYVHGVPLHILLRTINEQHKRIPARIAVSIAAQVLAGLQAAHTTVDELGTPLAIVHRDVSPQNVMLAVDGSARLLDFGVAKATMAAHVTRDGTFKGKLAYSAPEQVRGKPVQQSDVYALSVVLWELLVGHRMFDKTHGEAELVARILGGVIPSVTEALSNEADWGAIDSEEWKLISAIEKVVAKGLVLDLDHRHASAAAMEQELTKTVPPAPASEVAAWVRLHGKDFIEGRDKIIAAEEGSWRKTHANLGTIPGNRRLTQPPTDVRREPLPDVLPATQTAALPELAAPPAAPVEAPRPASTLILIGLSALVVLLGIGVVFAMVSGDDRPPSAAQQSAPPVTVEPIAEPKLAPRAAPVEAPPNEIEAPEAAAAKTVERKPRQRKKEPPPPPPPPPPKQVVPEAKPAVIEKPKEDCNPPYYFEGTKKVFKPNCL
jgi:serine/threonine protein kinase